MNVTRIKIASDRIEKCAAALQWLGQFGNRMTREGAASVSVHLNHASVCPGAKEAQAVLSEMARFSLPEIIRAATENCRNTIALSRDAILEEIGSAQADGIAGTDEECPRCVGTGTVEDPATSGFTFLSCPRCGGTGEVAGTDEETSDGA